MSFAAWFRVPSELELRDMCNLRPNFRALPLLGSRERTALISRLENAFGEPRENNPGAVNPERIYDELSQLSYHDRITILREVFRSQARKHPNLAAIEESRDPERQVRIALLNRLGTGADQKPRFAGLNMFFHLVADAPMERRYEELLRGEERVVLLEMPQNKFSDRKNDGIRELLQTYFSGSGVTTPGNPYERLQSIGICPGMEPRRTRNPVGLTFGPVYRSLPATNSDARRDLVAELVRASGPYSADDKTFKGFANPDDFFRITARYSYADRMALYREVLLAQGKKDLAALPEANLRIHLLNRYMYNGSGETSFAGVDRYFRAVQDAPRNTATTDNLRAEMRLLMRVDHEAFTDRNQARIRPLYQRFFAVGGANTALLVNDPYNRLELINILPGRVPALRAVPKAKDQSSLPARPTRWDNCIDSPPHLSPKSLLGFPELSETALCSLDARDDVMTMPMNRVPSPLVSLG